MLLCISQLNFPYALLKEQLKISKAKEIIKKYQNKTEKCNTSTMFNKHTVKIFAE